MSSRQRRSSASWSVKPSDSQLRCHSASVAEMFSTDDTVWWSSTGERSANGWPFCSEPLWSVGTVTRQRISSATSVPANIRAERYVHSGLLAKATASLSGSRSRLRGGASSSILMTCARFIGETGTECVRRCFDDRIGAAGELHQPAPAAAIEAPTKRLDASLHFRYQTWRYSVKGIIKGTNQ